MAKHIGSPIINADSRQVFAELPIGTAAPTAQQQAQVKHYFVGNLHIDNYYSASMFESDVMALLNQLFKSHDTVLMSGGSMMYIDAVCDGIDDIPTVDEDTREEVKHMYEEKGLDFVCNMLKKLDPEYYDIVDRKNYKRIVHALEICLSTGKTYTSFRKNKKKTRPFAITKIGLNRERSELYARIDQRVDQMIADGLLKEAQAVYPHKGLNALNTVGYKEMFDYMEGKCTLEEAIFKLKCNTHKYCRKQITWFKRDQSIVWFMPNDEKEILQYIDTISQ